MPGGQREGQTTCVRALECRVRVPHLLQLIGIKDGVCHEPCTLGPMAMVLHRRELARLLVAEDSQTGTLIWECISCKGKAGSIGAKPHRSTRAPRTITPHTTLHKIARLRFDAMIIL